MLNVADAATPGKTQMIHEGVMNKEPFEIDEATCIAETNDALKVESNFFDEDEWIPKKAVHEDSDIEKNGDEGTLLVEAWLARDRGWVED